MPERHDPEDLAEVDRRRRRLDAARARLDTVEGTATEQLDGPRRDRALHRARGTWKRALVAYLEAVAALAARHRR